MARCVCIDSDRIATLLGRSLSEYEEDNFGLLLELAMGRVGDLICMDFTTVDSIPVDLELVIARFFGALIQEQNLEGGVQSKQVEDFHITYRDDFLPSEEVMKLCRGTLAKYSACGDGIIHGRTIYGSHCI